MPPHADEISLGELSLALLRFFRTHIRRILQVAIPAALLAALLVSFFPRYPLKALLESPQLSLEEWRTLQPLLSDERQVRASARLQGNAALEEAGGRRAYLNPGFWSSRLTYRAALRRDDLKETPNVDLKNAATLGLEVSLSARSTEDGRQQLEDIAAHVRETLLWHRLNRYVLDLEEAVPRQKADLEIQLLQQGFAITLREQRSAEMRALLERYPELRQAPPHAVVSVEGGGGRFLSPLAQVVALEAEISEIRARLLEQQRTLEKLEWLGRFAAAARQATRTVFAGSVLGQRLLEIHGEVFAAAPAPLPPVVDEAARELRRVLDEQLLRAERTAFRAQPAAPVALVPSRRPLLVGLAAFAAAVLLVCGFIVLRDINLRPSREARP